MPASVEFVRSRSLWLDELSDLAERPALPGDATVDVVVVGAGLTGLWTAYHLAVARPHARIMVLEREVVGYGASGRNGGWAGSGIAGNPRVYAKAVGWDRTLAAARLTEAAIDEIGQVVRDEKIECDFVKGGTLVVAANAPQWRRLAQSFESATRLGTVEPGSSLLPPEEVRSMVDVPRVAGGLYTPHCARIQPARLIRGLAEACERRGVVIHEHTSARSVEHGVVVTDRGRVRAPQALRATEAWSGQVAGARASYLPLTSMMVATEPLPPEVWDDLGWPDGLTVRDRRHLFFYAQRTADGRIAMGGRGAPYRLRAPLAEFGQRDQGVWDRLEDTLREHFPQVGDARITHRWGGVLAVPRDWSMSVHYDPRTGLGAAGGYSGHGVVAAYLAGRGLADLAVDRRSAFAEAPWVGHRSRRWEPEPLRYLAANAIVRVLNGADAYEDSTNRRARRTRILAPVLPPG